MDRKKLTTAIAEAKRFIAKAEAYEVRRAEKDIFEWQGSRESGACRRASMDLTRALADLRRPA